LPQSGVEELVTPVPLSETAGLFEALLTKLTLPVALALAVGANTTENEVLCPAASVTGSVSPFSV